MGKTNRKAQKAVLAVLERQKHLLSAHAKAQKSAANSAARSLAKKPHPHAGASSMTKEFAVG
jgi:hypothetical protein